MKKKILFVWKNTKCSVLLVVLFCNYGSPLTLTRREDLHSSQHPVTSARQPRNDHLTNGLTKLIVLKLREGNARKVIREAEIVGFQFLRKVFEDEDYYLLRQPKLCSRCRRNARSLLLKFTEDPRVEEVIEQQVFERERRNLRTDVWEELLDEDAGDSVWKKSDEDAEGRIFQNDVWFNDPLYKDQWYLENRGQAGSPPHNDINVLPVWTAGIDGRGVRVSVLDDGVHGQNPELASNYDPALSYDFIYLKPQGSSSVAKNSHGTSCAAIVAGEANNHHCGVGVAFGARIGGPRVIDDLITDAQEAMSLVHGLEFVDIYTASWGPKDDGRHMAGPGPLAQKAFIKGITKGRQGRGAIYVWAAGNGGAYFDNCNADGYASSVYTLTFGALTDLGLTTYYTEPCSSVIASTYIGGFHISPKEGSISALHRNIKVVVPEGNNKCRENFQGTSAAAPMAAGAIALVLQANPALTWRDIQHIVIESSLIPSADEPGWSLNGVGKHFHPKVGFGVLDVARMVAKAQSWELVPPSKKWTSSQYRSCRIIQYGEVTTIALHVYEENASIDAKIEFLESVVATLNITHSRRKDLSMFLVSPAGTASEIFSRRHLDNVTKEMFKWDFKSLHFWGEPPVGIWKMHLSDEKPSSLEIGIVNNFQLTLFGTSKKHHFEKRIQPVGNLTKTQLLQIMEKEKALPTEVQSIR